jgi:two-component system, chemotaxis family, CheB/CheR fusion protein
LLDAYAPASVLMINAKHERLYYFGSVDRYLRIASGEDTRDVLALAREGLRAKLRSAIRRAEEGPARITVTGAHVKRGGRLVPVSITALPVEGDNEELFLVSFVDDPTPELGAIRSVETAADASRVVQLERNSKLRARSCKALFASSRSPTRNRRRSMRRPCLSMRISN